MDIEKLQLYDNMNSLAVRWLKHNADLHQKPLGIKNFGRHNYYHMWLLRMLQNYNVFTEYKSNYYIDGSFINYLYLRFIKGFKHLRYKTAHTDALMIEVPVFCDELAVAFNQPASIIEDIYKEYYNK